MNPRAWTILYGSNVEGIEEEESLFYPAIQSHKSGKKGNAIAQRRGGEGNKTGHDCCWME
jgi:hypothetical protein